MQSYSYDAIKKMADQVHEFEVTMTCSGCSGAVERVLGRKKDKGKARYHDRLLMDYMTMSKFGQLYIMPARHERQLKPKSCGCTITAVD